MSTRLTTDEQLELIWNAVIERGNPPIRTVDRWGDIFTIFDGWNQVEDCDRIAREVLPPEVIELAPVDRVVNGYTVDASHHIEWAIGEFGLDDQYSTCDHCYTAICTDDPYPYYWLDDAGGCLCGDCLKANKDFADNYLSHAARHLEDGEVSDIDRHLANPEEHGFICLNFGSACCVRSESHGMDHPAYDSRLTYCDREIMQLLGKAARLIDPNLQIVYGYDGGSNVIWARFDPNANLEYPTVENGSFTIVNEDPAGIALGYVIGLVFAKFGTLYNKRGK